jgi:hypothetical protein
MGGRRRWGTSLLLIVALPAGTAWAQGLQGEYWQNSTAPGTPGVPAGTPNPVRIDATVNFTDADPTPAGQNDFALANENDFVVRWTGFVQAPITGTITFTVETDDGSQLRVNNQTLIESWVPQAPIFYSGTVDLVQGQWYPIQYLFYEAGGGARARLSWSYTGQGDIVIPSSALSPTAIPPAAPLLADPPVNGDGQVTLNWTHSGTPAATEYRVYIFNGGYTQVGTASNLTFTVTGLTNGQTYTFVVRAFNMVESPDSNMVNGTPALPAPRFNDHAEGSRDRDCGCGSAPSGASGAWFWILGSALLLLLPALNGKR